MIPLSQIAQEIMECEFDNDTNSNSLQSIQCWLESNIGSLNTLINTSYCCEDGLELDCEASSIYKQLYLWNHYSKRARNALRGIVSCSSGETDSGAITAISDGESRVTFANKNETAKIIRGMAQDSKKALDDMVVRYNLYQSEPRQVGGIEDLRH
jgi:hypothetical protein